jgi:hypothetical protein
MLQRREQSDESVPGAMAGETSHWMRFLAALRMTCSMVRC